MLKLGGNIPCGRVKQYSSSGGVAVNPRFLMNFPLQNLLVSTYMAIGYYACTTMSIGNSLFRAVVENHYSYFLQTW